MNNTKTTKRALLSSVTAMLICVAMLIGTTFAWFTDKVTSSGNIIKSGRLDISATFQNTDANGTISYDVPGFTRTADNKIKFGDAKTDINENNKIIDEQLWEPGAVGAKLITVNNDGNLAAKIMLNFNVNDGGLQNALWYDFIMVNGDQVVGTFAKREMSTLTSFTSGIELPLMPKGENGDSVSFILVYGMKEEAGNEYQDKSFSADVTIFATQYTHESDSFDAQYDTNATYLNTDAQGNYLISNADELVYFAKSVNVDRQDYTGKTVKLTADIDLAGKIWIPVGQTGATQFQGVFDGQGKTIKNMTVNNPSESENVSSGFFGWIENTDGVVISNVKFENANVTGSHYVGVVTGYLSGTISGCEVNNSTVIGINMNNEANGDKIGGIVGYVNAGNVTYNKVTNSTVSGNRDIGGIAGAVVTGVDSFNNNSVSDTTITYETDKSYASAGEIVSGRTGFAPDATNTATNVTIKLLANASTAAELVAAMTATDEYVEVKLSNDIAINIADLGTQTPGSGEYKLGGTGTKSLVIDGNSHKMTLNTSYMSALGMKNPNGELIFKNIDLTSVGNSAHTWNMYDFSIINVNSVKFANVNFDKPLALNNVESSSLNNVSIDLLNNPVNHSDDAYALWISASCSNVVIDGLVIDATDGNSTNAVMHRAIKIADQYVDTADLNCIELSVSNATIKSEKKAAILVTNTAGATINLSNVDISNVSADSTNAVWNDADRTDAWDLVTVNGCTKFQEQ